MTFTPVWVYLFRLIDYLLFERAVFGFLDHLLVGGDVDFHAAILRSSFNCVVGCDRFFVGLTFRGESAAGYSASLQIRSDCVSSLLRKPLVHCI